MTRVKGGCVAGVMGAILLAGVLGADQSRSITISGRVIDETGQPVARAKVTCYEDAYSEATRGYNSTVVGELVTQADGAFTFRAGAEHRGYRYGYVIAEKSGFAMGFAGWQMEADQQSDIVLGEPKTLAGVVVDEDGKPIAQAAVSVSALSVGGQLDRGLSRTLAPKILTVGTDADGRFAFTNLPAGATVELTVKKAGRATIDTLAPQVQRGTGFQYAAGRTDIKLIQPVEAKVEGVVVDKDSGRPVPGVTLRPMQQGGIQLFTHGAVTAGQDGTFQIGSLPAGSYELALVTLPSTERMAEWVALPQAVTLDQGQALKDVKMEIGKGGIVEILVTSAADGKPVPNASVGLQYEGRSLWSGAESDANGLARVRLVPGTYRIQSANAPGYTSQRSEQSVTVAEGQTHRMNVTVQELPRVSGVVRDPNGAPVAGASLSVLPGVSSRSETVSDSDGRYAVTWDPSFWGERDSTFCLVVRHPQRNLAAAVELGKDAKTLDVTLAPAVMMTGKVVDPDGKGIVGARMTAMLNMSNWGSPFTQDPIRTDADGNFRIGGLVGDRRYTVEASADGYGSRRVSVQGGDSLDLEPFTLARANLTISGQVVDMEGNPVSGARLDGYGEGQPSRVSTQTDAEGKFVLPGVCEAPLNIQAEASRGGRRLTASVVTDGGASDVRIVLREGNSPVQRVGGKGYDQIVASGEKVVAGVVVDESGKPVAGVPVGVCCHKKDRDGRMSWMFSSFSNWKATTDNQGRFAIVLEDGEFNLLLSPDKHAATIAYDIPCNTKDLKMVLEKGGTIEGRLLRLEKGQKVPVPNAEVKIEQTDRAAYTHLGFDRDRTTTTDPQGKFRFEHIQTKIRPSASRSQKDWQPDPRVWQIVYGGATKSVVFPDSGRLDDFEFLIRPDPQTAAPLAGRPVPAFDGILIDPSEARAEGVAMLICFFDFQQRPSRNAVLQLAGKADSLKQQGVAVIAVQAVKTDRDAVDAWRKENRLSIPIGIVQGEEDETRFAWGIKAVPWLILTDARHTVLAEGFAVGELDSKLIEKKP